MNWRDLIEFRAPYQTAFFKGTETRVLRLMLCLASGWTDVQILKLHPELNEAHLEACRAYGHERSNPFSDFQLNPQLFDLIQNASLSLN